MLGKICIFLFYFVPIEFGVAYIARFYFFLDSFYTFASVLSAHNKKNFNFFAKANDSWNYVWFNKDGKSILEQQVGFAAYDETGALVLDGFESGTKLPAEGKPIEVGKKYTFELNLTVGGTYHSLVVFCGIEHAKISNIVWTNVRLKDSGVPVEEKEQDVTLRKVGATDPCVPVEPVDGKVIIDAANCNLQLGVDAAVALQYAKGYTYAMFDLKFPQIAAGAHKFTVGATNVWFDASTGAVSYTDPAAQLADDTPADPAPALTVLKVYDAQGELVTGALTADTAYTFVFDLSQCTDLETFTGTLSFAEGFAGVEISAIKFVDGDYIANYLGTQE